jgi:YesN/AraC family two-component response regulator
VVLEARDGTDALRIAESHPGPIHLLLTDVVMPDLSGREVARRVNARRPDIKILFMSGYTDEAIAHHGVLDERTTFLGKPFSPEQLAVKVHEVLVPASA